MSKKDVNYLGLVGHTGGGPEEHRLKLTSRRTLAYGPGTITRILLPEEDEENELERHQKDISGAMLLMHTEDSFLTCGADHSMIIWRTYGTEIADLSGHTDTVLGIWELEDDRIVSLSRDKTIRVWNSRSGEQICSVDTTVDGPSNVQFSESQDFFCLIEKNSTRILTLDGESITVLKKQRTTLNVFLAVGDDKWLTSADQTLKLWSRQGKMLHEFKTGFSFDDGYLGLRDGGLVVADKLNQLLLFDSAGRKVAVRNADESVATAARNFFKARASAFENTSNRPTVDDFFHRNSPRAKKYIGADALEERDMPESVLRKNRSIWDFFNRPDIRSIKTFQKDEILTTRASETTVSEAIDEHNRLQKSATRSRIFFAVTTVVAGIAAAVFFQNDNAIFTIATVISLLSLWGVIKSQLKIGRMRQGALVLNALMPEFNEFISSVKKYRRGILAEVPIFKSEDAYSGSKLDQTIERTIDEVIEPVAWRECGITDESEIIIDDKKPLRLRGWALIQGKSEDTASSLDEHNQSSFWWSNDLGRFVFAVEFLQFIFLGKEKIDVFSTYYDFITDKFVARQSHTFYYKDVTNIAKMDSAHAWSLAGYSVERLEATEIVMAVSSGQRIALTVLNEQSLTTLKEQSADESGLSSDEAIARMEREIEAKRKDEELSEEDRDEEVDLLQKQISELRSEHIPEDDGLISNEDQETKADKAIAIIRKQINEHKKESLQEPGTDV